MSASSSRRPPLAVLIVVFTAFVALGLPDGALGVAWPTLRGVFGRSVSDLGALIAVGSVGYFTASSLFGWLHGRLGTGILLVVGSSLLAAGLSAIAVASSWVLVMVGAIVVGLGGGLVDAGVNAHAALAFDVRSVNLLHACYGVGATVGPIIITISLTSTGSWRAGYLGMGAVQLAVLFAIFLRRRAWKSVEAVSEALSGRRYRRRRSWLLLALFFLYTGIEVATGQWAFTLLNESRGYDTASAGAWVAVYWGGLTVGRLIFGVAGDRITPLDTLHGSMAVALVGLGLLWVDPAGLGVVGLPIASLGFAAIFPTLISITPARVGADRSTASIGYQLAAANLGVVAIPWALGLVAENLGLESLGPGLFLVGLALAAVHLISAREAAAG